MEEPGEYRKVVIRKFPAQTLRETPEGKYWTKFQSPKVTKQTGAVSHIHFQESKPNNFAVTCGLRVGGMPPSPNCI